MLSWGDPGTGVTSPEDFVSSSTVLEFLYPSDCR